MERAGMQTQEEGATSRRRCVDTEACILNEPLLTEDRAAMERDNTCAGLSLPREVQENGRASQDSETWADEVEQVEAECGCGLDKRGLARVFAIVNVMLGASMLIIPWAFAGSGLVVGTLMVFGVGCFCQYTSSLILRHSRGFSDFSEMCLHFLGPWAWHASLVASLLVLTGALMTFHTLMSDFLNAVVADLCLPPPTPPPAASVSACNGRIWELAQERRFAPLPIAIVLFPFTNLRDLSHLSRAASYGIMAVAVSIAFIITFSLGLSLDAFHRFGGFVFTQYAPAPPLFQASRNIGHTRGAHFAAARRLLSPQSERNVDFFARTFDPLLSPESATPDVMPLALRRPGPDTFAATLGQGSSPRGHEAGREGKGKPGPAMRSQEDMVGQDGNITSYHAYNGRVRVPLFGRNFGPLASILPVSYFVHNLVITLMKGPEPTRVKMRQHATAFGVASLVYWLVGALPVFAFAGATETCLSHNASVTCPAAFGCEWRSSEEAPAVGATSRAQTAGASGYCAQVDMVEDFLTMKTKPWPSMGASRISHDVVRGAVLLQLMSIFPLVCGVIRGQFFTYVLGTIYPGPVSVCMLNLLLVGASSLVASQFPDAPGQVLAVVGAVSGTLYVCVLPILVHLAALAAQQQGRCTVSVLAVHVGMMLLGSSLFAHGLLRELL